MKLILYYTVVFHMMIFHKYAVVIYEQKGVSKQEAGQECSRRRGSLVNYREIEANPSTPKYFDQLENGDTAWIAGYAEFSSFLYWQGCYSVTNISKITLNTFEMEERSLFLCSKVCWRSDPSTFYVGVKNTTCYCFEPQPDILANFDMVNASLCHISCSSNGIDSCGGDLHMDLYGVPSVGNITWGQNEPTNRQCVYYKLNLASVEAYTASCHTLYLDGFVCKEVDLALNTSSCNSVIGYNYKQYCFIAQPSTRQEAYQHCLDINGRIIFFSSFTKTAGLINHVYWTSLFRSIGPSDNLTSNSVCIAATKINDNIYFEPDDCSVEKFFLCKYNELTILTSVTNQAPGINKSKQNSNILIGSVTVNISLVVSVVAFVVTAVVIYLLYKFKMWVRGVVLPLIYSGNRGEGVYNHPIKHNAETDSLMRSFRHYAIPDCKNHSTDTQSQHLTEQPDSQIPLAESSLVEEDLNTVELLHVYEGLSDKRQHVTYELTSRPKHSKHYST